jgi:hypothetical protein
VDESIRAVLSSEIEQKLYYTNIVTKESSWKLPVTKMQPQERTAVAGNNYTETISEPASLRKKPGSAKPEKKETVVYTVKCQLFLKHKATNLSGLLFIDCHIQHRSVTFAVDEDSQSQSLLSPEQMSYVDYFWGDKGDETGMDVLVGHHIKGKLAMKDIAHFIRERAALEEAHARNLSKLANTTFSAADHCEGTLKDAWCCLKKTLLEEAENRLAFAEKLLHEVEQPILKFKDGQKKERKLFVSLLGEDRKQLASKYSAVQKSRASVAVKHRDLSTKSAVSKDLEDEKIQSEIRKAKRKSMNAGTCMCPCNIYRFWLCIDSHFIIHDQLVEVGQLQVKLLSCTNFSWDMSLTFLISTKPLDANVMQIHYLV